MTVPDSSASVVRLDGPWTHRDVAANGARFHIAELGDGPLVLLLHGFPQFWWAWRHQLTALADAGYRAVAMDLRGVGGSDRTPRGYDPANLALDITGVIRSLGEPDAALVGHDLGGYLAWTAAVMRPKLVRRLAVASMPHPRRWRSAMLADVRQSAAGSHVWGFQRPWLPERRLVADDAAAVGRLIREWSGPRLPEDEALDVYRRAMTIPSTAHCSIEPYRWMVRSLARPDGFQFNRRMKRPVRVPTLHLHGSLDPVMRTRSAAGSGEYVEAPYRWRLFDGLGHFPHEEDPAAFSTELINWLKDPEPTAEPCATRTATNVRTIVCRTANCLPHRPIAAATGDYGPWATGRVRGMGWTHDYRDAPSGRGPEAAAAANAALSVSERGGSGPTQGHDPNIGIPRIIRRRARWVSARLRHPRSR